MTSFFGAIANRTRQVVSVTATVVTGTYSAVQSTRHAVSTAQTAVSNTARSISNVAQAAANLAERATDGAKSLAKRVIPSQIRALGFNETQFDTIRSLVEELIAQTTTPQDLTPKLQQIGAHLVALVKTSTNCKSAAMLALPDLIRKLIPKEKRSELAPKVIGAYCAQLSAANGLEEALADDVRKGLLKSDDVDARITACNKQLFLRLSPETVYDLQKRLEQLAELPAVEQKQPEPHQAASSSATSSDSAAAYV